MKKYFKLLFVALFATLSFALVSCGDDDDDNNNSALVGTWEAIEADEYGTYTNVVTFTKDGKFTVTETEVYQGDVDTWTVTGTYTVTGDLKKGAVVEMIGVDEDGDPENIKIIAVVDGDKLYTVEADDPDDAMVFTRK